MRRQGPMVHNQSPFISFSKIRPKTNRLGICDIGVKQGFLGDTHCFIVRKNQIII